MEKNYIIKGSYIYNGESTQEVSIPIPAGVPSGTWTCLATNGDWEAFPDGTVLASRLTNDGYLHVILNKVTNICRINYIAFRV